MNTKSAERRSQNNLLKRPALNGAKRRKFLSLRHFSYRRTTINYFRKNKGLFLYGAGHCRDVVLDEERIKYDQGQGADHRARHQ